jgi:hypothetical protein
MIRIYKIIALPVVLYVCETWTLTISEGYELKMNGNRVFRTIQEGLSDRKMQKTALCVCHISFCTT